MRRLYRAENGDEFTIDIPIAEDIPREKMKDGIEYRFVPEFSKDSVTIPLNFKSEEIARNRPNYKGYGISGRKRFY